MYNKSEFLKLINLFILAVPGLSCGMRDLCWGRHAGSSSLTRVRTRVPCIGSVESYPLDHQGSPKVNFLMYVKHGRNKKAMFYFSDSLLLFFCYCFVLFCFMATSQGLWDFSSLTRDWTQVLSSESVKS